MVSVSVALDLLSFCLLMKHAHWLSFIASLPVTNFTAHPPSQHISFSHFCFLNQADSTPLMSFFLHQSATAHNVSCFITLNSDLCFLFLIGRIVCVCSTGCVFSEFPILLGLNVHQKEIESFKTKIICYYKFCDS